MSRRERWREKARRALAGLVAGLRVELGPAAARRHLYRSRPATHGLRGAAAYWRHLVEQALAALFPPRRVRRDPPPAVRAHPESGVTCGWCGSDQAGCVACRDVRARFGRLSGADLGAWAGLLKATRDDPAVRPILADWLEEHDLTEEANHTRTRRGV